MAKKVLLSLMLLSLTACYHDAPSQDGAEGESSPTGLSTSDQSGTGYTINSTAGEKIDDALVNEKDRAKAQKKADQTKHNND